MKPKHLIEYLHGRYCGHMGLIPTDNTYRELTAFVDFSIELLKENPPLNVSYLPVGLGIHLSDRTLLSLTPQPEKSQELEANHSVPITRPMSTPGLPGMDNTPAIGIFGSY